MKRPSPPHEQIEELVAADVLHGLDDQEHRRLVLELARHGPDCAECQRLIVQYSEVAGRLALTLQPVPLSVGAEEQLMREALGVISGPAGGEGAESENKRGRAPRMGRVSRWLAVAAAAAAIAVIGGAVGYSVSPGVPSEQAQAIAFVAQPGTRLVAFAAHGRERLAVAYRQGERRGWIIGTNVPTPSGGRVYELWVRPSGDTQVHPAGTFVPRGGTVAAPATLSGLFTAVAVSVEPHGGSRQPTTTPIFIAPVTL